MGLNICNSINVTLSVNKIEISIPYTVLTLELRKMFLFYILLLVSGKIGIEFPS